MKTPTPLALAPSANSNALEARQLGPRVGRIHHIDGSGVARIDFPGNPGAPAVARLSLPPEDALRLAQDWKNLEVLIVFVEQDMSQPVIVGIVSRSFEEIREAACRLPSRMEIAAEKELSIRCGDARIVLREDGKVAIGGREIDARAQQKHRIRGGTVQIN